MEQPAPRSPRRPRLGADLSILALIGVLLIAALGAGGAALYQQFYSPAAFVTRYLDLLSAGRAADALLIPGVAVDRVTLEDAGIDPTASEALLRQAALAPLDDVAVVSTSYEEGVSDVTVSYTANGQPGQSTFHVEQDGWIGVAPRWRFSASPLAAVQLSLVGADRFAVNGFTVERGQVSASGAGADPASALSLLVFTPGLYSVTVDTPISESPGVSILADAPLTATPVDVTATATKEFVDIVQQRVEEFLTDCTTQQVLQPTACPFGYEVHNRIEDLPTWSIAQQPVVAVEPDGRSWVIPATDAVAHIEVDIRSLFDGSVEHVSEDVPFQVNGTITILGDGSASIRVGSPQTG
ncbi:hypothetical protein [Microbacterium sp. CIAB417]|uniref:hypothetical protein n=1 Tax=Microbacterium sp. CIAB417 TaxID=2860287 RepID=UPI001FACF9E0|nr:hypothetical protein [Microbacterium sp. CIAB417]